MTKMNIEEVMRYLPHRYPFLLIDRVLEVQANASITAIKNVTINEPFFNGHFPTKPVMPGVLMVEAMAQATGILAFHSLGGPPKQGELFYFAGIDGVRFKRIVEPGDQLKITVNLLRSRNDLWKVEGTVTVEEELGCSATLMVARPANSSGEKP